jgi:hypothetical protein
MEVMEMVLQKMMQKMMQKLRMESKPLEQVQQILQPLGVMTKSNNQREETFFLLDG